MKLHIIYTDTDVLLSKARYASWVEIQDEYDGYKASIGPWDTEEVIEYLADEYPSLQPSAQHQVCGFLRGGKSVERLTFADA